MCPLSMGILGRVEEEKERQGGEQKKINKKKVEKNVLMKHFF